MTIQSRLDEIHRYLMYNKFPYHSVSVVHRPQNWGFRVIFTEAVRPQVTDEIKMHLEAFEFTYSFV